VEKRGGEDKTRVGEGREKAKGRKGKRVRSWRTLHGVARGSTVGCTTQHNTIQYNTTQHSTIQYTVTSRNLMNLTRCMPGP
jgi:hypothetical protein